MSLCSWRRPTQSCWMPQRPGSMGWPLATMQHDDVPSSCSPRQPRRRDGLPRSSSARHGVNAVSGVDDVTPNGESVTSNVDPQGGLVIPSLSYGPATMETIAVRIVDPVDELQRLARQPAAVDGVAAAIGGAPPPSPAGRAAEPPTPTPAPPVHVSPSRGQADGGFDRFDLHRPVWGQVRRRVPSHQHRQRRAPG